jgi:hypothetical protein
MAFWESVASGTISGFMSGAGELFKDIRTAITGKEPMTAEQQYELLRRLDALEEARANREQEIIMGQQELTKIDAQSASLFKSGWRPALGWACVFGISYQFVLRPLAIWVTKLGFLLYGAYREAGLTTELLEIMKEAVNMPSLDMPTLLALVGTLLGVGGMRSLEKRWGVAAK